MKPIIFAAGALLVAGVGLSVVSCGSSIEDKIEKAISNEGTLSVQDYDRLSQEYEKENGDTTGFYDTVVSVFDNAGYDLKGIRVSAEQAQELPRKVTVYLDNTSSMMGYMNPRNAKNTITTDFTDVFTRGIGVYYAGDSIDAVYVNKPVKGKGASLAHTTFDDMSSLLTSKKVIPGDAFTMDALLDSVIEESVNDAAHSNISFIITDGILSGTNGEIRGDRNFNRNNAGELNRRIMTAVKKASEKGYGAAIYKFNAAFDGDYYKYDNGKVALSGSIRPFYLIAIGERDLVKDFTTNGIKNFKPVENQSMIMISPVGSLIPVIDGASCENGEEQENLDAVIVVRPYADKVTKRGASLRMSFPLDRFPEYMRDLDALKNGLKIKLAGNEIPVDSYKMSGSSLVVPFKIEAGDQPVVEISLTDAMPAWIVETSTSDDSGIKTDSGKTFLLDEFAKGLKWGIYDMNTPDLGSVRIQLDWQSGETD